jgi:diguanylate cyclase (GGDEF)-like protein
MNSNQSGSMDAHEELIQFLYQAPIGLVQVTPDGEIMMINPMSAQLLMPLSPDGNLSNLFDVLGSLAPQLRAQVASFNDDSGMICDGLHLEAGTVHRPLTLSLRLLKLGDLSLMACLTDVTLAVVRNASTLALQLRNAARTDSLTALPNRAFVTDRLTHLLERVKDGDSEQFAVFFLNCDRFIGINDAYGRTIGDDLLRLMADRLTSTLRPRDTVDSGQPSEQTAARLSGDEFVVLLEDLSSADAAHSVAQRLVDLLCRPYVVGEHKVHLTVSIGVVLCAQAVGDADEVLLNASIAMHEAKRAGGGRYWIFEPEMRARATRRGSLEAELRIALSNGELFVVYQPQVSLTDGSCTGVEALVRWLHPVRGVVSPVEFIDLAEETGLIDTLGEFVLNEACRQFVSWQIMLADKAPRKLSVNVSRAQLVNPHFASQVQHALRLSAMDAQQLQLEVTESLAAQDSQVQVRLHELKALGLTLSLDDFGTGYSSLSSLSLLPVDVIKIDRSFVCQAESSAHHRVLIEATILVARSLGMGTVAEGVETIGEARLLQQLKCDVGQGYLYSKPLAAAEATRWFTGRAMVSPLGQDQN